MFNVTMQNGFLYYTLGLLALAAGLAGYDFWRDTARQWIPSRSVLVECSECNGVFLSERQGAVLRCPRCQTVCSRKHT
ncbi:MAG: hypothetical protein KAI66_17210 [Lentisphaeria bacterium]|nr:hypothetical protein [Lentisphaeria bacterium]